MEVDRNSTRVRRGVSKATGYPEHQHWSIYYCRSNPTGFRIFNRDVGAPKHLEGENFEMTSDAHMP